MTRGIGRIVFAAVLTLAVCACGPDKRPRETKTIVGPPSPPPIEQEQPIVFGAYGDSLYAPIAR